MSVTPNSEDGILAIIDRHFPNTAPCCLVGRGDDCCVFNAAGPVAISTDLFIEDVHFRRSYFSAADIGYKSLAVNVSDLAGSGATPLAFSLGLGLPKGTTSAFIDEMMAGMAECAARHHLLLSGGDLSRADKVHIAITVLGETPPDGGLRRRQALAGDEIFIWGAPGLARAGLALLEGGEKPDSPRFPTLIQAHLRPQPRNAAGIELAKIRSSRGARVSAMDLSDGLARDLPRLLGKLGADVRLPMPHEELLTYAATLSDDADMTARKLMWLGGEEFALVATCDHEHAHLLADMPGAVHLGTVSEGPITVDGILPSEEGFDHFAAD